MYLTVESFALFFVSFSMALVTLGHILSQMVAPSPAPSPAHVDVAATIVAPVIYCPIWGRGTGRVIGHYSVPEGTEMVDGLPQAVESYYETEHAQCSSLLSVGQVLARYASFSLPQMGNFSAVTAEMIGYWILDEAGAEEEMDWEEALDLLSEKRVERVHAWLEGMGCE